MNKELRKTFNAMMLLYGYCVVATNGLKFYVRKDDFNFTDTCLEFGKGDYCILLSAIVAVYKSKYTPDKNKIEKAVYYD